MRLLKTKKRKTWHSICYEDYEYQSKDTYYIVELSEDEYRTLLNTIDLSAQEWKRIMSLLDKPSEPNEALVNLMKNNEVKTDAGPCIVKYVNGQPDLSDSIDTGPCIVKYDKNGNPIINTVLNTEETK